MANDKKLPPLERSAKTAIGAGTSGLGGTVGTYLAADKLFNKKEGKKLDFGSGRGDGAKAIKADTYEPYVKSKPNFTTSGQIPSNSYDKITSLNVLNVIPPEQRKEAVKEIARVLSPNGEAIVSTRGKDVENVKNKVKVKDGFVIGTGKNARFQKGFTNTELKNYIKKTLGDNFKVQIIKGLGRAAVKIVKGGGINENKNPTMPIFQAVPRPDLIKETDAFQPTKKKFNEGGTSMKKNVEAQQLEMFGDVGKMVKPKTNVDPISGNEVPKGSVPQEVRDDIPAQLSEGEFVLPADVVRYHGLEKLMGLRQQAKLGLNKMNKMGQMGNSEEATIPDDIPFKPKEMQQGGINIATPNTQNVPQGLQITQPKTQIQTPSVFASQQQVQPVAMPKPITPPVVGVPKPQPVATPIPQTQPKQQQPSFKDLLGTGKGQLKKSETIIYTNPETKEEMYIPFIGGEPLYPIPTGFVKKADAPKEEDKISDTAVKTTQTTQTTPLDEGENKELSTGVKTTKLTETIAKNTESGTLSKLVSGLGNIIKQGGLVGFVANELFSKKTEDEKKAEKEQFTPQSLEEQSKDAYGDSIFRIKNIFGSEPTFKYGSDAGDVDVSTGGTFHASGIALDEDGNAATNNGVMSYGSFKEWANHLGAGASSGWHGGIISASKYESLGEKGKGKSEAQKNYDDYASQVGASSGGQKKSELTDLEGGVASGLAEFDASPEGEAGVGEDFTQDKGTGLGGGDYGGILNKGGLMSKPKPKSMKYGGLASKR